MDLDIIEWWTSGKTIEAHGRFLEIWGGSWTSSDRHIQRTVDIHFPICKKASKWASSICWRAGASQCSVHQDKGPCLAWCPSSICALVLSEFNSHYLFVDLKANTSRPWSVFPSPFHPFTPSHHFRAKWIWFSKYSFAASVLGLLMSDGNCFCYFPKWKSTAEEQLVCCNVLLPLSTSQFLQVTQSLALTASSVSRACGTWLEECVDGGETE